MKQIKKFLGVFLALAMVVGVIGAMPSMEVKAAAIATVEVVKPVVGTGKDEVKVIFKDGVYDDTVVAAKFVEVKLLSGTDTTLSVSNVSYDPITKTATLKVNPHAIVEGDKISVKLMIGGAGNSNAIFESDNNNYYGEGPYTSDEAVAGSGGGNSVVYAAPKVVYDEESQVLYVRDLTDGDTSEFIYIGVPKTKGDKTSVTTWDVFQKAEVGVNIDLSVYGVKKDVWLWVHVGTEANYTEVKVSKNTNKLKATYNYKDDAFSFTLNNSPYTDIENLEFRVGADTYWREVAVPAAGDKYETNPVLIEEVKFSSMYGTTIYFRQKAVNTESDDTVPKPIFAFPSAEAKLKIAKQANAPKVTVDYTKATVSFAKGVQVLYLKGIDKWTDLATVAGKTETAFKDVKDAAITATKAATVNISDLGVLTEGLLFYARTAAADNGKKPASKIVGISISAQGATPEYDTLLTQKAVLSKGKLTHVELSNNVKTGDAAVDMQYAIDASGKKDGELTWKSLNSTKTAKIKVADLTDKIVYFRIAGDKTNSTLPTQSKNIAGNDILYVVSDATATVSDVTVSGVKGSTAITDKEITITLANDKFKDIAAAAVVTSWFKDFPAGLEAKVKTAIDVADGTKVVTIIISGTPTAVSDKALNITIPKELLDKGKDLTVTANEKALFAITEPATP